MQIKTNERPPPTRIAKIKNSKAKIKKTKKTSISKDTQQLELSHIGCGNGKWNSHFGK